MVRGAATGISAIVDPYGRIREQLPLGPEGIIDGRLPGDDRRATLCPARPVGNSVGLDYYDSGI